MFMDRVAAIRLCVTAITSITYMMVICTILTKGMSTNT